MTIMIFTLLTDLLTLIKPLDTKVRNTPKRRTVQTSGGYENIIIGTTVTDEQKPSIPSRIDALRKGRFIEYKGIRKLLQSEPVCAPPNILPMIFLTNTKTNDFL